MRPELAISYDRTDDIKALQFVSILKSPPVGSLHSIDTPTELRFDKDPARPDLVAGQVPLCVSDRECLCSCRDFIARRGRTLFVTLARVAEWRVSELNSQQLENTAWAVSQGPSTEK